MRLARVLTGLTILAGLVFLHAPDAIACSCMPTGPPRQNAFQVDAVFAGTVRSVTPLSDDGPPLPPSQARIPSTVRVELADVEGFLGMQAASVSALTAGSGPAWGYAFKVGER